MTIASNINKSGIYSIENTANGRVYVGSAAISFRRRWQKHRSDLRLNKHRNARLQKAFNKYGEESFRFTILAACPPEYVLRLEQFFIDAIKPFYNICLVAGSSIGVKRTEAYKEKIRKAITGQKHSSEVKEACRIRMIGNTYTKGTKRSLEAIEKSRHFLIGRKHSAETKAKIRLANTGRKYSEVTLKRMSEGKLKFVYTITNTKTNETTVTNNLRHFTQEHNLKECHLSDTLKGHNLYGRSVLQHKGYKLVSKSLL